MLLEMEQVRLWIFVLTGCYHTLITKLKEKQKGGGEGERDLIML